MPSAEIKQNSFTQQIPSWITYIGIAFLCLISMLIGGVFGYRLYQGQNQNIVATPTDIKNSIQKSEEKKPALEVQKVEGVFWILPGKQPVCPDTHIVKGAFQTSGVSYYYLPDSKQYNRVQPDVCFASENFARDTAGFVRKF